MIRHLTFSPQLLLLFVFFCGVFPLWAQHQEERALTDFDRIEFIGRGDIFLYQGDDPRLQIDGPEDVDLRRIKTKVQGRTLYVEYDRDEDDWLDVAPKLRLYITYPSLRSMKITGLADVESPDVIQADRFALEVEGMGEVELRLDVESLEIASAGTANIQVSGEATEVQILNDGTGTIDAFDLVSQEADVEVNGTGLIRINTTERLRAEANGFGATVKYRGAPKKTYFDKSGFASIKAE